MTPTLPLLLLTLLTTTTRATITLSTTGKQLHSRAADFGLTFEYDLQYVALLQYVPDDMHLCHGVTEIHPDGEVDDKREVITVPSEDDGNSTTDDGNGYSTDNDNKKKKKKGDDKIHITPSHGVPVAILAKRGQCTYETKAKVASTLTSPHGVVRFVIVYDDKMEDGEHLITMMPKDGHDDEEARRMYEELGLVFVSYESGMALHEYLNTQPSYVNKQGGPQILIDGTDGWFPPYNQSAASFAFLLMLFGCVCSFSVFLSTSSAMVRGNNNNSEAVNEHHLFLLGGGGGDNNGEEGMNGTGRNTRRRRGNGLRLLTMEEVETLPTIEYTSCSSESDVMSSSEEDDRQSGSSSSRGLELRDKTDMPYLNDNGEDDLDVEGLGTPHEGHPPRRDEEEDDQLSGGGGGGLCQALKSPKKEDPYFRHASCSICLDEYEMGEQIRVLPCQHTFHSECIFPWLTERSPTCPLCKAMFEAVHVDEDEEQQQQQQQQQQSGSNDTANDNEEEQSHQAEASIGDEGFAASEPEDANNNDSSAETSRRRTTTGLWRNLFGANATSSRSDDAAAAANAINNEGNTLEEPLLPDV
ncbi:hypothetical protein QTG54_015966 [Skeletonema marinoi]|uniref:RING-type domain-containing protein n=1 Tax=Skeletonema marinoi TaxID=267567 RepID=A0AAD9D4H7_9STRA|nr:hypothetical protein QTG54_015966 [Skeletonema marinoi]